MKALVASLQIEGEERQVIRIRRSNLWQDSLRFFKKNSLPIEKQLSIHFIGEEAADEGGPRREFLHLLMKKMVKDAGLLEGQEDFHVEPSAA